MTNTRSLALIPVAALQSAKAVEDAFTVTAVAMLQKPAIMPAIVVPLPPTTRFVVLATVVTDSDVVVAFVEVAFTVTRFVIVEVALFTTTPPLEVVSPSTLKAATAVDDAVEINPANVETSATDKVLESVVAPVAASVPPVEILLLIVVAAETTRKITTIERITEVA